MGFYRNSADRTNGGTYVPQSGDLIFFTKSTSTHMGIVIYCDGTTVWTVEGNTTEADGVQPTGEGVYVKSYALDYEYITSYGKLPYAEGDSFTPLDYSGKAPTTGVYITATGGKSVYEKIEDTTPVCVLPQFEMLEVLEIEVEENGTVMLYSKCRVDGVLVYGWIESDNADDVMCVVQIYSNPAPDLSSDVYDITDDGKIKGVSVGTTVSALASNLTTECELKLYKGETELALDAKLGTGMVLKTLLDGAVVNTYVIVVKGDVNGDAKISGIDYLLVKRNVLMNGLLTGAYADAAMLTREGKINFRDFIMLKRHVLGTYTIK